MKKKYFFVILFLTLAIFLSGFTLPVAGSEIYINDLEILKELDTLQKSNLYNLSNFILPDNLKFIALVEELDTPKKICDYMRDNFTYKSRAYISPDPYTIWKIKEGDCNDFATFGVFVANYHKYETYQIIISFKEIAFSHGIAVYKEDGKYNYSNIKEYYPIQVNSFKECVKDCALDYKMELESYLVYDYKMNLIEFMVLRE